MQQIATLESQVKRSDNSGRRILDALVGIAAIADAQFAHEMLDSFWMPFEAQYKRFIRDISANLGLNERPLYHPHEPFDAYNKHHFVKKSSVTRLLPYIDFVDDFFLRKTSDDEDLLLVSYHIWHNFGSSSKYFSSNISTFDRFLLRLKGLEEEEKVKQEISEILKPYQLNQSESPLQILSSNLEDLFNYNDRLFSLIQKEDNYKENEGGFADLIWSLGVYTTYPEPIGYILFNKECKNSKFLPS
ncbi:MAG: hypothetical protein ACQESG_02100 [Nanobdellota archaeon]